MKILPVDLQKAKDNVKSTIEGYPRVEGRNISLFSFCKQFWNIPMHLSIVVFENWTRWDNDQNIFPWATLCLQRIRIEIRRGFVWHKRKLVLAKTCFICTIWFSDKLLAGSLVEIWQLIRISAISIVSQPIREKNQNLVFEHMIRKVNVSCPPSPPLNAGKEGMVAGW